MIRSKGGTTVLRGLGNLKMIIHGSQGSPSAQLRSLAVGCRGGLMMETVVAVMVFTAVGVAVLVGVSTTHMSGAKVEGQSISENIARNQMEYIFSLPYQEPPSTYPAIATPLGYSVVALAQEYVTGDTFVERVEVTVSHEGQVILALETLRAKP